MGIACTFNMDVIEAFVLNGTTHDVTILWENHKPLFRASDVGAILGIRHIRSSIEDFSEIHKVVDISTPDF